MNVKHNPERRNALIWCGVMVVGLVTIFFPGLIGMDGFNGGFALSFLGGFVCLMGIIATVIYFKLAATLDKIVQKENVLAHWQYTPEEWGKYTEKEHKEDSGGRRNLFLMVAVITVIVGLIFWAVVRDNPGLIALICLGIIAVTGLAAWLSGLANYRNNKARLGEVFIAREGAYLNRQLHVWKGVGNKLEEIVFENDEQGRPRIRIEYSAPNRGGRNYYTARIPVPSGQEERAQQIVTEISTANRK